MFSVNELMLNRRDFAQALDAVYRCAAKDGHLSGVLLSVKEDVLRTITTNGNMLAQFRSAYAGNWVEGEAFSVLIDLRDVPLLIEWLKSDSFLEEKCRSCHSSKYTGDGILSVPVCLLTKTDDSKLYIKIDDTGRVLTVRLLNIDDWPNYSKVLDSIHKVNDNKPDKYLGINPSFLDVVYNSFKAIKAHAIVFEPSGKEQPFVWSCKHGCVELMIIQMPMRGAEEFIRE